MLQIPHYSTVNEHKQNASLDTAKDIDIPAPANAVLVQAITQNIRYKLDGTATASGGFRLTSGNDPILIPLGGSQSISFHEENATATLEYQFVKVQALGY